MRVSVAIGMLCLGLLCLPAFGAEERPIPADQKLYAVVVSEATYANKDWRGVVDALVTKHHAKVFRYAKDVLASLPELSAWMPDFICFVAQPEEAGREFVIKVHRLTRRLDDDPYTDAVWGILTGYTAEDALRIARLSEPLILRRGASGAGVNNIEAFPDGFASYEGSKNEFWTKTNGAVVQKNVQPDPAWALAEAFNTNAPQIFFTSGHATEKDWQIGYNTAAGQFRCKDGRLYAFDTNGKYMEIRSPNPKVYVPMGNCLIGHISDRDCMALAWMHSGGVCQMVGYTVVTWYGNMGWGTRELLLGGRYNLAEAFYFNNQALVHRLRTNHTKFADVEFHNFSPDGIHQEATKNKLLKLGKNGQPEWDQDAAGLLWDRDTVAFYGDPAFDVRMPKPDSPWKETFSIEGEKTTFTLTALRDGDWPGKPVMAFLPRRLTDVKVIKGEQYKPVVTDNFILLPLGGKFKKGEQVKVVFQGKPMVRPDPKLLRQCERASACLLNVDEALRPAVRAGTSCACGSDRRQSLYGAGGTYSGANCFP